MRLGDYRESSNVEDGRGGGGIPIGRATGGVGVGGLLLAGVLYFVFGIDPSIILNGQLNAPQPRQEQQAQRQGAPATDQTTRFVSQVLATTEDSWTAIFREAGRTYEQPALRLFDGQVQSACGSASAASGPFYCPRDQRVYLDTAFFRELSRRFGAPGDFAAAYVIAHEVGHHVQNQLGRLQQVQQQQAGLDRVSGNQLQVRVELQADCYAGVWANRVNRQGLLEQGDVEEAMRAASAIGDDTLQEQTQGRVVPESFTHGTSQQRVQWFMTGVRSGNPAACDTFRAAAR